MAKKFGGFTPQQKEVLARKMGFNGPMDKFGTFLQSSPAHQQKFLSYEQKAKQTVEGQTATPQEKPQASFATGGVVTPPPAHTVDQTANWEGTQTTADIMSNPMSAVTPVAVTNMEVSPNEMVSPTSGQATAGPDVVSSPVAPTATAETPTATAAPQVGTTLATPSVYAATADMQAAQGTVSDQAQVTAVTAMPSSNATVQGQLDNLMADFEGGEVPSWAAGAVRTADAMMASRGLGSSSMAASATTQAVMESALQIAIQDASTYSQFEMQNLNNQQQAALVNAQSFLQMDLANLDAEQQMVMFKSQSMIQSLFSDQAAENASRQFNATSQGQTDQFFASLKSQTSQFNATQKNAMEQFKVSQTDSINMFNRQMNDATEQFNAANRLVIDQSNAEWRRAVTTSNNAAANEANRVNAMNAANMTLAAYNNMMQKERDFYSFSFTAGENALNRANELAVAKYGAQSQSQSDMWSAVGSLGASIVSGW